jgi:hypothetical protein
MDEELKKKKEDERDEVTETGKKSHFIFLSSPLFFAYPSHRIEILLEVR